MSKERSLKKSFKNTDGSVTVEYDNGVRETSFPLETFSNTSTTKTSSSSTSSKTSSSSSSASYNSSSSSKSYSSSGSYTTYTSYDVSPTLAFTANGIEFWGCSKYNLGKVKFNDGDLIINFTGTAWTPPAPKYFIKNMPTWMKLPSITLEDDNNGDKAEQLLLDWPDMKTPPSDVDFEFWRSIILQLVNNGVKRVFCCCSAGKGRTGTGLTSLLLATGAIDEPEVAIDYIRENYYKGAIETKDQEEYIFNLVYEPV